MIEQHLYARLKTVAANVYPNVAPLNYKTPAVIYQRIDTEPMGDLDVGVATEGFVTFQVSVSAPVFGDAMTLARAIKSNLATWENDEVQSVSWLNEHPMTDDTTDVTLHRVLLFFKFYSSAI